MTRLWRACLATAVAAGSLLTAGVGSAQTSSRPVDPEAARSALAQRLVPHSAVGIDPASNQVVVTIADAAVDTASLVRAAEAFGSTVRVKHIPGRFDTVDGHFRGGNGISDANGSGVFCTLGFNVTNNRALTAGHCTQIVAAWNKQNNGQFIGPTRRSNFPGDDFGLIRNDGTMTQRGDIQAYAGGIQEIDRAADPVFGQAVCKSGVTTGRTCGRVTATNVTVDYPTGRVFGLTETTACVASGDSGGPLYDGSTALGLTSGGTLGLDCNTNPDFRSFFQPVKEALRFYGVDVL